MRAVWKIAVLALVLAGTALAVSKGDTLYVRSRNTRLVDRPGGKVVAVLQPGNEVKWQGALVGKAGWHEVTYKGKKGALLTANLSSKPPSTEIVATEGKRAMDTSTFLSSGAATKALGPGAVAYGKEKDMTEAVEDVEAMERLTKAVTFERVLAHTQSRGLPSAVGASEKVSSAGGSP